GIHPYILDTYQPPIEVSEWYGCRYDCPARYQLRVKLFRNDNKMIDEFLFRDVLEGEKQNQWLKITHVFKNYGPGLRRITFEHSGKDRSFWAGHYGSKMAGACVCVKSPKHMMGQFSATPSSSRVMFDEEDNNGLVLCDKYLPVEVLIEIFCHVDCKTLLRCQLVCKRWKMLMNHVWHKKTEWTLGKPFPWNDKMPWTVYYLACTKKPYERNLVKNHSGDEKSFRHWDISYNGGHRWTVEKPPAGMPELPQTEPLFKDRQTCFATSYEHCTKVQVIILTDEGIHPYILDTYQPPIEVSEWYGCRYDCPARYQLRVKLFRNDNKMIDEFLFRDVL
ncbi:F-box only protein 6-like, partial [Temnothorax curvispinosus]|uniref:F-box only protein 6-like n=1 Tax=Temnothorax curvispinosus TaxID=300111 RepID=A0A6J1QP53_9HYME